MKRGLLFLRFNWAIVFKSFLVFVFGVGLSGCGTDIPSGSSTYSVPCTPQAPNVNIYRLTPDTWANGFFQNISTPPPITTTSIDPQFVLLQAQQNGYASYASYQYLISEVKNWSAVQTIKLDATSEAQIVVTFISPQLVQAVYFREVLSYYPGGTNFQMNSQSALDFVAKRDELVFFVAVTATTNNNTNTAPHMIDIPVDLMTLMNAENLKVPPKHDDHILDQPINSSMEPVFGYLAYPLAVENGANCSWVLDPTYNKSITITAPSILVDGVSVSNAPYNWVIPYSPLIDAGLPQPIPTFVIPPGFNESQIPRQSLPPRPVRNLSTPNGMDENIFWENYAMFLWKQIVRGNY